MTIELWLAFVLASTALLILPGPTILLVLSYALAQGRRSALPTVVGVALGDLTALTLSLAGLGALLAASATAFTLVKWLGALYLIWLGVRMWRAAPALRPLSSERSAPSPRGMAAHAFWVTVLNPKSIAFFVAFLPQFIRPSAAFLPQAVLLGATFVGLATLNTAGYALVAGRLRTRLTHPRLLGAAHRVGGSVLIGAGVLTAALRRPA